MRFASRALRNLGLGAFILAATALSVEAEHAETAWKVASPSVVTVQPTWPGYQRPGFGAPAGTAPEGTGVAILEPGLIVTAAHVVARATEVAIRDHQGQRVAAEILAVDPASDLALLKVELPTAPITIAEARPANGTHVCAIGNAFGLDLSITCGIVSANARSGIGFNPIEDFIQTDATVNPGASGGALVNEEGQLVGLVSAIFTKESDANVGVNFAVSTELLLRRVEIMLEKARKE